MGPLFLFCFFSLFHPVFLSTPEPDRNKHCGPFQCGGLGDGEIQFPYRNATAPENCGIFAVGDCDKAVQKIQLEKEGKWYRVESISQGSTITITDNVLENHLKANSCKSFNFTLPNLHPYPHYASFQVRSDTLTMLKCRRGADISPPQELQEYNHTACEGLTIYYYPLRNKTLPSTPPNCSTVQLPANLNRSYHDIFGLLTANFSLDVDIDYPCYGCMSKGGNCSDARNREFKCINQNEVAGDRKLALKLGDRKLALKLGVGLGVGVPAAAAAITIILLFYRYNMKSASSNLLSANTSSPSSKSNMVESNIYFGVPVFSYTELEEATNYFHHENELGDGGFGTVYYGKLRDGREVAIKRLYEHNFKRFKQFMNEIEILTLLRHKNLVLLYGCTSHHSRDLLLVYEYVSNGTVADHLHGDLAKSNPLAWPIRMKIAIETASALTYLHVSEIVHRDVKTNNILLDNNFGVKVADFGLSRLFPNDVTHVSTAPQGTPGYIDPEYYHCYQLTDRSDVYSFGVVLIELISSMPAVDISRHHREINLASLAMSKIHECAFDELIDPYLGYNSDDEVKRMITSVAELAFLCLQLEKGMRPSMNEVLERLRGIESGDYKFEHSQVENNGDNAEKSTGSASPQPDCGAPLLKNVQPQCSPDSPTDEWFSSSSSN